MSQEFQEIRYAVDGGVATVTLHRPEKLNAFTATMLRELIQAFDLADADDAVRAVIVTGSGRAFCAGADLSSGADTFDATRRRGAGDGSGVPRDGGGLLTLRIFECTKPVIAAINGAAVGVGATMTLAMDLRLASTSARIGFVFARRGITMEAASSWFLPRLVGIQQAAEWVYTGRVFEAEEALKAGLVRSLHAPGELIPAARGLAGEIADNSAPISVALCRQMMWRMLGAPHPMDAHRADSRGIYERGRSADVREGVEAFLQKRAAAFPMKVSDGLPDLFPGWEQPQFQ